MITGTVGIAGAPDEVEVEVVELEVDPAIAGGLVVVVVELELGCAVVIGAAVEKLPELPPPDPQPATPATRTRAPRMGARFMRYSPGGAPSVAGAAWPAWEQVACRSVAGKNPSGAPFEARMFSHRERAEPRPRAVGRPISRKRRRPRVVTRHVMTRVWENGVSSTCADSL
jgi:hypothetical protein